MKFSKQGVIGFYKGLSLYALQFSDISKFAKQGMSAKLARITDLESADLSDLYWFGVYLLYLVIDGRKFDTDILTFVFEVLQIREEV